MPALRVQDLVLRLTKGTHLTFAEADGNLVKLRDACNALADIIAIALNPDGTLKDGAAGVGALADRSVTNQQLSFDWAQFAVDTGSTNNIVLSFTPKMDAYADGTVLFLRAAANNTGEVTVNVDGLGAKPLLTGSLVCEAGDVVAGAILCIAYYAGSFHLVTSAGGGTGTAGGAVTVVFEQTQPLPGNGNTDTFTHNLGAAPENYSVYLVCTAVAGELGYGYGAEVPIGTFTKNDGTPAFTIASGKSTITVTQNTATIYAPDLTNPTTTAAITSANWKVRVRIRNVVATTQMMQPALTFTVGTPDGAIGYGKDLFFPSTSGAGLFDLDMTTGTVRQVAAIPAQAGCSFAPIMAGAGTQPRLFWTSDGGLFSFRPDVVGAAPEEHGAFASSVGYKPVAIVEAGGVLTDVYCVGCEPSSVDALSLKKFTLSGSAVASANGTGGPVNLINGVTPYAGRTDFLKFESAGVAVLLFQYNPVKKRFYVMTATGFLHIFQVGSADLVTWWALSEAGRAAALTYVKTLVVGGGDITLNLQGQEQPSIEFDLVTGQEKALYWSRRANSNWNVVPWRPGIVTRIPWFEA
jgi:hypothetical protein